MKKLLAIALCAGFVGNALAADKPLIFSTDGTYPPSLPISENGG